jgi:ribosomal protein L34E
MADADAANLDTGVMIEKRGRGRPRDSKNKPKDKRRPGRPLGSKNKPKASAAVAPGASAAP